MGPRTPVQRSMPPRPIQPPTNQQLKIHAYMLEYQAEHGAPPSLREICGYIGARSSNAAFAHMKLMLAKGLVRHRPGVSRGWTPVPKEK